MLESHRNTAGSGDRSQEELLNLAINFLLTFNRGVEKYNCLKSRYLYLMHTCRHLYTSMHIQPYTDIN